MATYTSKQAAIGQVEELRSPLAIIEELVQDRAKAVGLETGNSEGRTRLRIMVTEEIDRWRLGFQQGLRPHDLSEADVLAERAMRNLVGYGPLEALLEDDDVYEVMINGPTSIFVKRHSAAAAISVATKTVRLPSLNSDKALVRAD